ncbi:FAR1-related sequence 5-like protein [Tanacetum coccineum]
MVVIDEHLDHDIGESSMSRDTQVDNQIVILPEHLQHPDDSDEFRPTPNGTPYWVPDVPEDEKPKKGFFFDNYNDAFEMYQLYSEKARFNIRKAGFKRKNGQITHNYIECNRARKPRRAKEVNTLNEDDREDGEIPESYMVLDFVENHNHPLMNLNNMDLSKARRQLHFDDYIFIHRASLSNLGPTRAHRLKVALVDGYDKVRSTSTDYCNLKRCVTSFIGDRDAQMYGCKFVPFTRIDNHQKCVTFGAALLSDETTKSFCWMLEAFLKTHKKQPPFAVTNQDSTLRNVVVKMFPDSHHRLCMWHITEKLPGKVLGDLAANTNFRKDFHKLVWNVYIGPEVFKQRWDDMISRYNLHENKWMSDMYSIRERWVPSYFKEMPMCGLMKTTSRSESSNSFFQVYSHEGNTLVQFMLCFESAMEKQRYTQRVLDNASNGSTLSIFTELPIEKHACAVYTPSIFREVQHEIRKSLYACTQIIINSEGSVETCIIRHRDKRSNTVIDATIYGIDKIPVAYLNHRWTKNVLPAHLLDKRHRYGPCIEETNTLASQIHQTIEDCISFVRNDTDKLSELLSMVKVLKKKLEDETHTPNVDPNKEDLYADMLGVTVPDKVVIKTPRSIFRSKGTRRIKSAAEIGKAKTIARTNRKVPFKRRTCSKCGGKGHNKATCKGCNACGEAGHHKGLCKKFPNQDKDGVDDEDEGDNEDEVDDENGVDNEDELDEDEDDEEDISEEE